MAHWMHRWFGLGGLSPAIRDQLAGEGIVYEAEGIPGWVTLRNFKAPGRYHSRKSSWFLGCVVVTNSRFVVLSFGRQIINVNRNHQLELLSIVPGDAVEIAFDAKDFNPEHQGSVRVKLSMDPAPLMAAL